MTIASATARDVHAFLKPSSRVHTACHLHSQAYIYNYICAQVWGLELQGEKGNREFSDNKSTDRFDVDAPLRKGGLAFFTLKNMPFLAVLRQLACDGTHEQWSTERRDRVSVSSRRSHTPRRRCLYRTSCTPPNGRSGRTPTRSGLPCAHKWTEGGIS